jgi:hypothetical protein
MYIAARIASPRSAPAAPERLLYDNDPMRMLE